MKHFVAMRIVYAVKISIIIGNISASAYSQDTKNYSGYPEFSWDTVPLYAHLGKSEDDFTDEEIRFLADHFTIAAIEKAQAIKESFRE